jgi:hypothetical protein
LTDSFGLENWTGLAATVIVVGLRVTSPSTLLLGPSVVAVFVGQAVGVWLWRRRHSRTAARFA